MAEGGLWSGTFRVALPYENWVKQGPGSGPAADVGLMMSPAIGPVGSAPRQTSRGKCWPAPQAARVSFGAMTGNLGAFSLPTLPQLQATLQPPPGQSFFLSVSIHPPSALTPVTKTWTWPGHLLRPCCDPLWPGGMQYARPLARRPLSPMLAPLCPSFHHLWCSFYRWKPRPMLKCRLCKPTSVTYGFLSVDWRTELRASAWA